MRSIVLFALALGAAATAAAQPAAPPLVWPAAPEAPRIRFVGTLQSETDLGKKESFFGRLKRSLAGTGKAANYRVSRPFDVYTVDGERVHFTDGTTQGVVLFDRKTRAVKRLGQDVPGGRGRPRGMGGDGTGRVYVADPGTARVVVLSATGTFERAFGGRDHLYNPVDVAVDTGSGRVYVADAYLHQIVVFDQGGGVIGRIGKQVRTVAERRTRLAPTQPHGAAGPAPGGSVERDSTIVSEHSSAGIGSSEPRDLWQNRGGEAGEFRYPSSLAVGPDGTLFVVDQMNFRIQAFDRAGGFVRQIGKLGDVPGALARPKGVAVDSEGHVYVSDAAFNNVQVFNPDGQLLLAFGGLGHQDGQHWMPLGIGTDRNDRIYVVDRYNNRASVYQYLRAAPAAGEGPGSGAASERR
ncbi:MAG: 6-bladed beta-propeller [Gemmatimonadales bacterium]|nr:6-bladed beta-propeller [Gemmatimonadales bacterium]